MAGAHRPDAPTSTRQLWLYGLGAALLVIAASTIAWTQTDLDDDGADAWRELNAGTDPFDPDSDHDDLADGFELDEDTNPHSPDTDADGIDDRDELDAGTNPREPDSDSDELTDPRERELGTDAVDSDSDEDEISDGREVALGTNPLSFDTDGDRLADDDELLRGANPWVADTDGDELEDLQEFDAGPADCDGNGIDRIAEADDDADGLLDPLENETTNCNPDTDDDTLLDGYEAARVCIVLADCDADALTDNDELGTEFDRLDPDTFDVGLLDGISSVFKASGQPPSRDQDGDGIPDAWETSTGLIDWQHFDPQPNRTDMNVEFVRVEGPDSSRLGPGSMQPTYEDVATFFEDEGKISMRWIETTVQVDEEPRPPRIPSARASYYETVLERARASDNPYVTTVVMNPQHNQSGFTHQGSAPIRGMLAAVDYGAHTRIHFESGGSRFSVSPLVESLIVAERTDLLGNRGVESAGHLDDGRMFIETDSGRLTWRPFWFSAPVVLHNENGDITFDRSRTVLDRAELADTIAHELGHTLGLCHNTLEDCQANLSAEDREKVGVSTMDPRRETSALEFLPSEWARARDYVSCPPQGPIQAIAEGQPRSKIIQDKYAITLENVLNVNTRQCGDFTTIPEDLTPEPNPVTYQAPYTFTEEDLDQPGTVYTATTRSPRVPTAGATLSLVYGFGTLVLAGLAGGVLVWYRRPSIRA